MRFFVPNMEPKLGSTFSMVPINLVHGQLLQKEIDKNKLRKKSPIMWD